MGERKVYLPSINGPGKGERGRGRETARPFLLPAYLEHLRLHFYLGPCSYDVLHLTAFEHPSSRPIYACENRHPSSATGDELKICFEQ